MISFWSILYLLIIRPIEMLIETVFSICYVNSGNALFSLIMLSIVISLICLPLYMRADHIQKESDETIKKLKPVVDRIKKTFRGDERAMMISAYYRQNGYNPVYSLRSSISLLLQIPFFISAYRVISSLTILKGMGAGPISDLGSPDALMSIGSFSINILPLLMTAVNIVSGLVYSKGMPLRDKLRIILIAAVFLVLLYNSPAGLVIYWTCNNIFSLIKNIVTSKLPPRKVRPALKDRLSDRIFFLYAFASTVLLGAVIPSDYLSRATDTIIRPSFYINPLHYILFTVFISAGIFIFWGGIFYFMSARRKISACVMEALFFILLTDYFVFYSNYGDLTKYMTLIDGDVVVGTKDILMNIMVIVMLIVLIFILGKNVPRVLGVVALPLIVASLVFSFVNMKRVNDDFVSFEYVTYESGDPEISLSNDGKNVVVIMLDRAQGYFIPYIMDEDPALKESFDGFVYYPDTVSFGPATNVGIPALLGGYDYTPDMLNKREDMSLKDKTNEAISAVPILFSKEGYDVAMIDPPYVNYKLIPDITFFDDIEGVSAYSTGGKFNEYEEDINSFWDYYMRRDLFSYSLMLASPVAVRPMVYDDGYYNDVNSRYSSERFIQVRTDCSHSTGYDTDFLDSIAVLKSFTDMTKIGSGKGGYTFINIMTTHSPALLEEPGYTISASVDNSKYDSENEARFGELAPYMDDPGNMSHYHANMASIRALAEWFDELRREGVYDNTRIIIVSDHGAMLYTGEHSASGTLFTSAAAPLLMVKDFDAHGFTVSDEFMTNADVALISMEGLIDDPVNPYTGDPFTSRKSSDDEILFFWTFDHNVNTNNGNRFEAGDWYRLTDRENILDADSWEYIGTN